MCSILFTSRVNPVAFFYSYILHFLSYMFEFRTLDVSDQELDLNGEKMDVRVENLTGNNNSKVKIKKSAERKQVSRTGSEPVCRRKLIGR